MSGSVNALSSGNSSQPNNLRVRSACQTILIEQRDGEINIDHQPEVGGAEKYLPRKEWREKF